MPGQQVNRTTRAKASLWNIFASALVSHNLTLSLAICRGFASRLSPQTREGPAGCGVMLGCDFFLPKHFHLFLNSRVVGYVAKPDIKCRFGFRAEFHLYHFGT